MYVCMYVERERERERERDRFFVRGKRSLFFERGKKIVPTFFRLSELGPLTRVWVSPGGGNLKKNGEHRKVTPVAAEAEEHHLT
jgi:hypothetical protein